MAIVYVELEFESDDVYLGSFPQINIGSELEYYITATNSMESTVSHPIAGWHNFIIDSSIGDINGDSLVNVLDIVLLVNLILSNENNNSADLNSDGIVNVLDIIQLINIILH